MGDDENGDWFSSFMSGVSGEVVFQEEGGEDDEEGSDVDLDDVEPEEEEGGEGGFEETEGVQKRVEDLDFSKFSSSVGAGGRTGRSLFDTAIEEANAYFRDSNIFADVGDAKKSIILQRIGNTEDLGMKNIELLMLAYLWKEDGKKLDAKNFKTFYDFRVKKGSKANIVDLARYIRVYGS